jgi:hypothetical protein
MLQYLEKQGFKNVIFVGGSDRVADFDALFNKQNGIDYNFDSIKVVSSGARDPDAEGAEGMSASKMRAAAIADDFESFKTGLPAGLQSDAESVFAAVRQGLEPWIEKVADESMFSFLKTEPPKKKWDPSKDSRVVSNMKDNDAWVKLLLDKHRRGIEITDREWDALKQWKLKKSMAKEDIDEHIVKVKGGYELKSKHGNKNLGKYPSKAGAEKRERQVQYFKHAHEESTPFAGATVGQKAGRAGQLKGTDPKGYPKNKLVGG